MSTQATMLSKDEAFELSRSIAKRGVSLNRDIQKIAATAIGYANVHGDVTVAQNIVDNIRDNKGLRLNSFVRYLENYGQLAWDKETKNFVYRKRDDVLRDPMELFLTLAEHPWYEAIKSEQPQSIYDVQEMVKALITKVEKLAKSERNTIEHLDLLDTLKLVVDPTVELEVVEVEPPKMVLAA